MATLDLSQRSFSWQQVAVRAEGDSDPTTTRAHTVEEEMGRM